MLQFCNLPQLKLFHVDNFKIHQITWPGYKKDLCTLFLRNYEKARVEYEKDRTHAEKSRKRDEMLISVDMQKVILLPRLEQYKRCLFTRRLVSINQSFVPIGKQPGLKPRGVLWHEAICGRKDEDVSSAFRKEMSLPENRDIRWWLMWLDNCAGQNKCWTLYTMLVFFVNSANVVQSIKLKYFTAGHTFMSADSFHKSVEKEMNEMKNVYDFQDFSNCVSRAGDVTPMDVSDFYDFEKGLSQSKESKESCPLLSDVVSVEFRRGSTSFFFKRNHDDPEYSEATFLKSKIVKHIRAGTYSVPQKPGPRGIQTEKRKHILQKLGDLLPSDRKQFYKDLPTSDTAYDMLEQV